jgi:hypothetical protein
LADELRWFQDAWWLGAGIIFISPKGDNLHYMLQIHFTASNNVTEYEALIHGLKLAKEIAIRRILCFGDSDLVVHQVSGDWDTKDANMVSYHFYVQQLCGFFVGCEFYHIPQANNDEEDQLSKIGSTRQAILAGVSLEIICKPSIKPSPDSHSIYVPKDPAPAKVPLPNPGVVGSEQEGTTGQPSEVGSTKNSGLPSPRRCQQPASLVKLAHQRTRGLQIHWSKVLLDQGDAIIGRVVLQLPHLWRPASKQSGNQATPASRMSVHPHQQRAVQAQHVRNLLEVHQARRSARAAKRNTPRGVRTSRIFQSPRGQSLLPCILLANGPKGCITADEVVQQLSALLQVEAHSSSSPQHHSSHLAVCHLGPRHGRAIQDSTWGLDTSSSSSGQVHEVDRGQTNKEAHRLVNHQVIQRDHHEIRAPT